MREHPDPVVRDFATAIHKAFNHPWHGGGWDNNDGDLAHAVIAALPEELRVRLYAEPLTPDGAKDDIRSADEG